MNICLTEFWKKEINDIVAATTGIDLAADDSIVWTKVGALENISCKWSNKTSNYQYSKLKRQANR